MPMTTTAEILTADAELHTEPWWEDGRNVTFVAQWAADDGHTANTIIGLYELPWEYPDFWDRAWFWVIESLDKEQ